MSLEDFRQADAESGYRCELARGVVEVVDVPDLPHGLIIEEIRDQLSVYKAAHRHLLKYMYVAGGSEARIQLEGMQSQRHPDISIYLTSPPDPEHPWDEWIPDIVIEVVSGGSRVRDYRDKREEYLAAGIREYWLFDAEQRQMIALRRAGDTWRERRVQQDGAYQTGLLPGFVLQLGPVFAAARP